MEPPLNGRVEAVSHARLDRKGGPAMEPPLNGRVEGLG
jgi:hypothetical protein